MITFKDPILLIAIPLILGALYLAQKRIHTPALHFSSVGWIKGFGKNWKIFLSERKYLWRMATICLFLLALSGPRSVLQETKHTSEGIDIVLAIDCSGSMAAEDFKLNNQRINRLAVVKNVVEEFIRARSDDKIAMIAFAGRAYNVCPLTTDHDWLSANLERIELNMLEDGTAIGSAISSSLSRLRSSQAKSKVVILLTDGMNNAGSVAPLAAAEAAKALKIKIYTIGAGTKGFAPFPARDLFGRTVYHNVQIDIDDDTLKKIADMTNAKYFRATDTESLRQIYQEIDKLEKTRIEEKGYKEYKELFPIILWPALAFLLCEIVLNRTILLRIP